MDNGAQEDDLYAVHIQADGGSLALVEREDFSSLNDEEDSMIQTKRSSTHADMYFDVLTSKMKTS
ncbi:MAG: hypothetical protein EAZ42_08830 [Verrucomicrobia bacterium]|nr:MAG: hypothetical protein EAZ42_08830 [Verrucomicrobiota bacterium]